MQQSDEFWEKWRVMADQAQGHSPSTDTHEVSIDEQIEQRAEILSEVEEEEKPLPTSVLTLRMHEANIVAVIQALAKAADVSVMVSPNIDGQVTVNIVKKPWDQVFKGILRTNGLTYSWEGDIIRVMTLEDMQMDLEIAKQLNEQMQTRLDAQSAEPLLTSVINIKYAQAENLQENIDLFLKAGLGEGEASRSSVQVDKDTNSLIVHAIRTDMQRIFRLVDKLDRPRKQITIKAVIVETTEEYMRELGVKWGGMYRWQNPVNGSETFITPGGTGMTNYQRYDAASATNGSYWTPSAVEPTGDAPYYESDLGNGLSGQGWASAASNLVSQAATGGTALGLMFGTLGGDILEVQLRAMQDETNFSILSSPTITTMDNEMAYTENGQRVPFRTLVDGEITIRYEDVVLRLEILPHIIDNEYLKMKILVKNDSLGSDVTGTGDLIFNKSQTETTLICRNRETVVISGLTLNRDDRSDSGIPGAKDAPLLGWLFKTQGTYTSARDILIFITPTILEEWSPGEVQRSLDQIEEDLREQRLEEEAE